MNSRRQTTGWNLTGVPQRGAELVCMKMTESTSSTIEKAPIWLVVIGSTMIGIKGILSNLNHCTDLMPVLLQDVPKSVTHFYWIEFSVVKQDFSSQFSVETQVLWRPWSHQILSSRINIIKHSMLFKRRLQ